jgi:hypothetical protein
MDGTSDPQELGSFAGACENQSRETDISCLDRRGGRMNICLLQFRLFQFFDFDLVIQRLCLDPDLAV